MTRRGPPTDSGPGGADMRTRIARLCSLLAASAVAALSFSVPGVAFGTPLSGTNALPALPFAQGKQLTDLTIAHVEVTQVIQRWGDASPLVKLVRGKPTVVRVYVQANGPAGTGSGGKWNVTWTAMDVYHGSTYIDTLWQQGPVPGRSTVDPKTLRDQAANTFNFLIPSNWTTYPEGLTLRVSINTQGGVPEFNSGNNMFSTTVTFDLTYPLTVAGLMFSDPVYPLPGQTVYRLQHPAGISESDLASPECQSVYPAQPGPPLRHAGYRRSW